MSSLRDACVVRLWLALCLGLCSLGGGSSIHAQQNRLSMEDTVVRAGDTFALELLGTWAQPVQGYALAIAFPATPPIVDLDVSFANTLSGAMDPEFELASIFAAQGYLIIAVLFEISPPLDGDSLPPLPFALSLGDIVGRIPEGTNPQTVPFTYQDGVGSPPISNVFVAATQSVSPTQMSGGQLVVLEPLPPPPAAPRFVRGDANMDGFVDIGDVIYHLSATFTGGAPPPCLDAGDANDDGHSDISDAVTLLMYLFLEDASPPPPFPHPGEDPTHDALGCAFTIH